ncbi:hypothetical protein TRFO_38480 [Tritrichomonas foetus]|uniref:Uncharacterized protein n=1 Tax=Tritrichomonas foetus TaxID=1144522 RepID=A0A1J4J8E1_9EUKA|nr:hypothetical protein TRFO_38480 [Tritrichomonas foetus]|eukprot:OHS95446.1 hypothetical protein TRFO_38480 [Tritrichomonas foetus]
MEKGEASQVQKFIKSQTHQKIGDFQQENILERQKPIIDQHLNDIFEKVSKLQSLNSYQERLFSSIKSEESKQTNYLNNITTILSQIIYLSIRHDFYEDVDKKIM